MWMPSLEKKKKKKGLEHVAMNHGVGGSNPSSPTTGQKGKGFYLVGKL